MSARSTACSASRAAPRSRRCRSNTACRRIPGRPPNCWRECAAPAPNRRRRRFRRRAERFDYTIRPPSVVIRCPPPHLQQRRLFTPQNSTQRKEHPMSFYDATFPAFLQILGSLSGLLTKAEAHCEAKKIQPEVLLGARLYPDMFSLTRQIQLASDFAAKSCARLTHSEVPSTPDTEKTFDELKARLAKTIEYVKSLKPEQFEGANTREVTFPAGPNTMTPKGQQLRSGFAFPNH